jgi:predicted membrane-bound mannosyltransferase
MNDVIEEKITIDDLRDKARRIGDMAVSEARQVTRDRTAQIAVAGAALVFAAVAIAFYVGRHRSGT